MKHVKVIAALAAITLIGTGCTVASPAPDENGLIYDKGPLSSTTFETCVNPGERTFAGPFDASYTYPAGQRYYVFTQAEDGRDREPYQAPTKDAVTVGIEGQVRFELTGDCDLLRQFHEKIGLRAQGDDGWDRVLRTYLDQPLARAITEVTQQRGWKDLYADPKAKAAWEAQVMELLPDYIEQAAGGDYFTNISLTLQKPILPDDLTNALQAAQTAQQQEQAQESRNSQIDVELESIRKLVEVLGPEGYVAHEAVKSGKITVLPIPAGSTLAVTGGK